MARVWLRDVPEEQRRDVKTEMVVMSPELQESLAYDLGVNGTEREAGLLLLMCASVNTCDVELTARESLRDMDSAKVFAAYRGCKHDGMSELEKFVEPVSVNTLLDVVRAARSC